MATPPEALDEIDEMMADGSGHFESWLTYRREVAYAQVWDVVDASPELKNALMGLATGDLAR